MSEQSNKYAEQFDLHEAIRSDGKEFIDEIQAYNTDRTNCLALIDAALNEGGFDIATNIHFFKEKWAMLNADSSRVLAGGTPEEDKKFTEELRAFAQYVDDHSTGKISHNQKKADYLDELVVAANQRLDKVRASRRNCINVLRAEIETNYNNDLLKELCLLLEEEIGSARAIGDEHGALAVSATIKIYRTFFDAPVINPPVDALYKDALEVKPMTPEEEAEDKVRHLVINKDIEFDDHKPIIRQLKEGWHGLEDEDEKDHILKGILKAYRARF